MEVRKPIRNQRISADWGRSVAERLRALDVSAEGATRTPTGSMLPPRTNPGVAYANPPEEPFAVWIVSADPEPGGESRRTMVRVRLGSVRDAAGDPLSRHDGDFSYDSDARCFEAEAPSGTSRVAAEAYGNGGWTLRLISAAGVSDGGQNAETDAPSWRVPLAEIQISGNARRILQLRTGDINPPAPEHWGETSPLVELPADEDGEWEAVKDGDGGEATAVAESHLVDIDVDSDGKVKARRYRTTTIDSNGNIVAISDRSEGADPDSPAEEPPECGNPLNESVADNPLDDDGEPGGQHGHYGPEGPGGTRVEDNPLDEPGDGGYTPECSQATGEE